MLQHLAKCYPIKSSRVIVKRHPLITILILALALRLAAACVVSFAAERADRDFYLPGDAHGYWLLAGDIAAGREYAIYDPPRRVMRMPGFPALIALFRQLTGDSLVGTRLLLAGVGTAACATVYLLGRVLVSRQVGLIACALAAVCPAFIGFSVLVLTETAFALAITLSLAVMAILAIKTRDWCRARVPRRYQPCERNSRLRQLLIWSVFAGLAIAVATYIRPTWLPAAGLFPLALVISNPRWRSLRLGSAVILTVAVALFPWALRNRIVTGHWVVTTLWVGPSLYDGLNPNASGASDMRFFDEELLLERMSEYEMNRTYRARAIAFARENPRRAIELALIKLWRYWRPWPGAEQFDNWLARLAVAGFYLPLLGLAVAGAWAARNDLWLIGLTLAPIILFGLVHCLFVGSLRYRLPAEYPLCVLSANGLHWIAQRWYDRGGNGGTKDGERKLGVRVIPWNWRASDVRRGVR